MYIFVRSFYTFIDNITSSFTIFQSFKVDERFLSVSINDELLFGGELAYSIKVDLEDDISGGVVWELTDYGAGRLLEFTLIKQSPIEGKRLYFS